MSSIKLKRFIDIYTGNSISDGDKDKYTIQNENTIPYISTKDIEVGSNKVKYYNDMYIDISKNTKFKIADKNSILLCIEGGSAGKKIAQVNQKVCFVNKLCCFNPSVEYNQKFVYFYLQSDLFLFQFNLNLTGLIGGVSQSIIKEFKIPFYSINLQNKIANYLDNKVSKIEQTIEDNKKEIELLEEYKINMYDKICLKGLNNNQFKKSNHYSIDKIPEKWDFNKVISVLQMPITDGPHETPKLVEKGIPFISADAVKNGKLDFKRKRGYITEEDYNNFCKKYIPQIDDIYMIKSGATTGKIAIVETDKLFNIWSPLAVFRCELSKMTPKYLYYQLQTNFFQKQVQLNWSFGTQQNIGMRVLEQLKLLVPSLKEQEEIVDHIEKEKAVVEKSIEYRKQIIDKLEEYKKSLIYEAVTGKIEV